MPQDSTSTAQQPPPSPTARVVFRYRSAIRLSTESSTFEFNPAIPVAERRAILLKDPGWGPWPPQLTGSADRDDLILAFYRIVASLSMRAGIVGKTAAAVKSGLFEMFGAMSQATSSTATATAYQRFEVNASIEDDGSATWEFTQDRPGLALPGVDARPHHLGKVGVELFLQNLLRIALLERLEELQLPAE